MMNETNSNGLPTTTLEDESIPHPAESTESVTTTSPQPDVQWAGQYNIRNPAVKRLLREAAELAQENQEVSAQPLDDNLFEWHFTIRGPSESEFELGIYHGRIILPPEYPMKPPSIIMLTPNGRFETGTKICLSISSYHPETWRPSWSIRTALVALQCFMSTPSPGAIGSLDYPADARRSLAKKSITWECPSCGPSYNLIKFNPHKKMVANTGAKSPSAVTEKSIFNLSSESGPNQEAQEISQEIMIQHGVDPSSGEQPSPDRPAQPEIVHPFGPDEGMNNLIHAVVPPDIGQQPQYYGMALTILIVAIIGIIFRRLFGPGYFGFF